MCVCVCACICVYIYMCVCVCACVCVCKTSFFFLPSSPFLNNAGGGSRVQSLPTNEDTLVSLVIHGLISHAYLQFEFAGIARGQAQNPIGCSTSFSRSTTRAPTVNLMILAGLHVSGLSSCRITTMIHSYLVWFLWWPRRGAIGPSEATLFRVNVDWLDFRIHTFKFSNSFK